MPHETSSRTPNCLTSLPYRVDCIEFEAGRGSPAAEAVVARWWRRRAERFKGCAGLGEVVRVLGEEKLRERCEKEGCGDVARSW
ncbi:hypothetical protein Droror1_Dr00002241 [Drosera rotundifolia]